MYKKITAAKTTLRTNKQYSAENIIQKVHRIMVNKEPIKDGAPLLYSERKDGVRPEFDIRTDRWDKAMEAMDLVTKTELARRAERHKAPEPPKESQEQSGQPGAIEATAGKNPTT